MPKQLLVCRHDSEEMILWGADVALNDNIANDLKKCGLHTDWGSQALDSERWCRTIEVMADDLNPM